MRRLLTPGWVALHLLALAAVAGCLLTGRWQWHRAVEQERFQNYAYAVEWCVFAGFAVFMWVKTIRDTLDPQPEPEEAPEPVAPPVQQVAVDEEPDDELAAYNAYLARLNADPRS